MAMDHIISGQSTITFTILRSFLFLYAIFSLSRRLRNKTPHGKPPLEVVGAWPVIRHLHILGSSEPLHIALAKMVDKYEPIFSLRLGVHPTLIVSSWEIAKECFTVKDLALASRPKILAFEVMGYNFLMFGMYSYGPHYCHMRKIITQQVTIAWRCSNMCESQRLSWLEVIYKCWIVLNNDDGSQNSQSVPVSCEMKKWFGDISFSVILRIVVGKLSDEAEEKRMEAVKAMRDTTKKT